MVPSMAGGSDSKDLFTNIRRGPHALADADLLSFPVTNELSS